MTTRGRLLAFLIRFLGVLPLPLNHTLGWVLGWALAFAPTRQRRTAARNLELCFPTLPPRRRRRLLRHHFVETGKGLTELALFWRSSQGRLLRLVKQTHGLDVLDHALADHRGILLAAPHLGAWELLSLYLSSRAPCAFLYRELRDTGIEHIVTSGRQRFGADMVRASGRGVRQLYKALREGAIVGVLPDQQPKRGQGVFAPFFGIDALTMVLFSKLARRYRGPTVLAWAERLPWARGYALHFVAIDTHLQDGSLDDSVRVVNQTIEQCVSACPAQYQWGYKRFSIRPGDEPPLY